MGDFSDDLIAFCYDRQDNCDPVNGSYYFDCLQDIAKGRESESLQMKATMLASQGVVGQKVRPSLPRMNSAHLHSGHFRSLLIPRC